MAPIVQLIIGCWIEGGLSSKFQELNSTVSSVTTQLVSKPTLCHISFNRKAPGFKTTNQTNQMLTTLGDAHVRGDSRLSRAVPPWWVDAAAAGRARVAVAGTEPGPPLTPASVAARPRAPARRAGRARCQTRS